MGSLLISHASIRVCTIAVIQVDLERLLDSDCLNKETLSDCVVQPCGSLKLRLLALHSLETLS